MIFLLTLAHMPYGIFLGYLNAQNTKNNFLFLSFFFFSQLNSVFNSTVPSPLCPPFYPPQKKNIFLASPDFTLLNVTCDSCCYLVQYSGKQTMDRLCQEGFCNGCVISLVSILKRKSCDGWWICRPHLSEITLAAQNRKAAFLSGNDDSIFLDAGRKIFTSI